MTDAVAIAALAIAVLAIGAGVLQAYWLKQANDRRADAEDAAAAAARNQLVAEQARDGEHVARIAADAGAASLRIQLEATQAALAAAHQELARHVHDAIAHGSDPDAAAAFRLLFAEPVLPAAGAAGDPATGSGDGAAAAVPAAGSAAADQRGPKAPPRR